MIQAGLRAALGDGEVHSGVVEHPLGVVGFHDDRLRREHARVELDALGEVFDGDVYVQAFHEQAPSSEQLETRTGEQTFPPQQFSVKNPSTPFIASKLAA
jgi:hypothetical protein